ncbi:glycosyltransferase family 4 protein [Crocinitomix catalasitica]|uniref:glycosyltransferase family 4 protein n=1 Tax=Crocinitomix catalasitica TaxID=184607 RepID=UPI00056151A2|nr:glycosyltransferase family 1 protein [Crocinitomix catalasitica]
MRIAVNTRFLLKSKLEGFGWFTFETLKRMTMNHPEHEFIFFFDRPYDDKFIFSDNITPVVLPPMARHPILFKIWFNKSVTWALKKYKADVFFSPDGYLSLKTDIPQIGVIHDLNFEHFPNDIPPTPRKYLLKYFPLFANKAAKIITVSNYSKTDIMERYKIANEKIIVAHNGASLDFKPVSNEDRLATQEIYTEGKPYFLFVGALHPRKNIIRLLQAFERFKDATNAPTRLLLVGDFLWRDEDFKRRFNTFKYKDEIHFTGHISDAKLQAVTAAAKALTFVSYFEGFGIPIVEAMRSGTPVMAGELTALPEVAGEAAYYVDPYSVQSIEDGLIELDKNEALRKDLIQKGLKRAEDFNWDNTAKIVWETIVAFDN